MATHERESAILSHVPPSRRDFVKRVLAGATFAVPLIATFSIENLLVDGAYAQCGGNSSSLSAYASGGSRLPDPGYVGPAVFQAFVEDNSGNTLVNGEVILAIDNDHGPHRSSSTTIDVRIRLTKDADLSSAALMMNGYSVANVQLHSSDDFGHHDQVGSIGPADISGLCDFDALLRALASQQITAAVQGTYMGASFNAQGTAIAASASPIVQING